jgi:hypothetical protein
MTNDGKDEKREVMAELHASKIDFVAFQDGELSESYLKFEIANFIIAREHRLLASVLAEVKEALKANISDYMNNMNALAVVRKYEQL